MKKGFLTSATATPATVATLGIKTSPPVATVAGVAVATIQKSEIKLPTVAVTNSPKRKTDQAIEEWQISLVREFMEIDGLTFEDANAMAAISVQPRPTAEWLAMIGELDALIARYCAAFYLSGAASDQIIAIRNRQSPASIPAALTWFKQELDQQSKFGGLKSP
ncbi:MAG: hypothetical protein V4805_15230 [Pseudomonadota bacterium]